MQIKPGMRWAVTIAYFASLPFMRRVWQVARSRSAALADLLPLAAGVLLIGVLLIYLVRVKREKSVRTYLALCAVLLLYLAAFFTLGMPIERVHLAQYGLLSMLVFWSMARGGEGPGLCLWAAVVTVQLGLADECVQGLLRGRIYDFNDVILNAKAAALGQALMAFVIRPWEGDTAPAAHRRRFDGKRGAAGLLLALALLACLTVYNVALIERGTPTLREDVHRGDGALARRDGLLHFGAAACAVNAAGVAIVLCALFFSRGAREPALRKVKTVLVAGLLPPLILLAGVLFGLRFR